MTEDKSKTLGQLNAVCKTQIFNKPVQGRVDWRLDNEGKIKAGRHVNFTGTIYALALKLVCFRVGYDLPLNLFQKAHPQWPLTLLKSLQAFESTANYDTIKKQVLVITKTTWSAINLSEPGMFDFVVQRIIDYAAGAPKTVTVTPIQEAIETMLDDVAAVINAHVSGEMKGWKAFKKLNQGRSKAKVTKIKKTKAKAVQHKTAKTAPKPKKSALKKPNTKISEEKVARIVRFVLPPLEQLAVEKLPDLISPEDREFFKQERCHQEEESDLMLIKKDGDFDGGLYDGDVDAQFQGVDWDLDFDVGKFEFVDNLFTISTWMIDPVLCDAMGLDKNAQVWSN